MKVRAFLADSVQSVDGKLYVLGAGWNRLAAGGFPARHDRVGIGVLLTIDDGRASEHNVELSMLDEREQPVALFTDPSGTEQFAITATFQTEAVEGRVRRRFGALRAQHRRHRLPRFGDLRRLRSVSTARIANACRSASTWPARLRTPRAERAAGAERARPDTSSQAGG